MTSFPHDVPKFGFEPCLHHSPLPELSPDRCGCGRELPCEGAPDPDDPWPPDSEILKNENAFSPRASSSLDTLETSGLESSPGFANDLPSYATPAEHIDAGRESMPVLFRHSGWLPLRRRVQASLVRISASVDRRLRFLSCGSSYHVLQSTSDPSTYKLCANACHDRFCLPCANERTRVVAHNVHEFLGKGQTRFITLTLRSDQEPLAELLDHLYSSFKALRKLPIWRKTQTGGVAFLEVKYNEKTQRWHPHFHVLSQGKFIDQAKLCNAWKSVTGTSWVCDVRAVKEESHAVAYVTKYSSKPFDRDTLQNDDRLDELVRALDGRRMILTFGNWKGLRVTAKPDKDKWTNVGTVAELARKAVEGDKAAMQILIQVLGENSIPFLHEAEARNVWQPSTPIAWEEQYFVSPY